MKVRVCSNCGKHNLADAWNCIKCGESLSVDAIMEIDSEQFLDMKPTTDPAKSNSKSSDQISQNLREGFSMNCQNCGYPNIAEARFCGNCGSKLPTEKSETIPNQDQTKKMNLNMNTLTLGKEVFSKVDIAPGLGSKSVSVKDEFIHQVERRQMPGVTLGEGDISSRTYTLVQKSVGIGANVTSAVRIEPYGTVDLVIEQKHFEESSLGTGSNVARYYFAFSFIVAGLILIPLYGSGIIFIIIGIFIWPRGLKGNLKKTQQPESILLSNVVQLSIEEAIDNIRKREGTN